MKFSVEYTDTVNGAANYCWVKRAIVDVPELTHYGYTGATDGSYVKADKAQTRELMRKAKAAMGLTGVRGRVENVWGDIDFRPYRCATVMFVSYHEKI